MYYINTTESPRQINDAHANIGIRATASKKADLLLEGVAFAIKNGLTEVWVENFRTIKEEQWFHNEKDNWSWKEKVTVGFFKESQGWHIFKNGDGWYFNMNNASKTIHKIEVE